LSNASFTLSTNSFGSKLIELVSSQQPSCQTAHHHDLMQAARPLPEDRRTCEAELPNDLWQVDCVHGPRIDHQGKRRKIYVIAFMDDRSRPGPYGEFFLSESVSSFLRALEGALPTRGLPRKIYTDNGAVFRSHHVEHVAASPAVGLIRARPYKPQGKGKKGRSFRTVRADFLTGFQGETLPYLNQCFHIWLTEIHQQRKRPSTGQTLFTRFTSKTECLAGKREFGVPGHFFVTHACSFPNGSNKSLTPERRKGLVKTGNEKE
jgi:transposase InsO family protein